MSYKTLPFISLLASFAITTSPVFAEAAEGEDKNYFVEASSYSTTPETEPPRYVRTLSKTGYEQFKDLNWLDAGLESRFRYEYRKNDFRRSSSKLDEPLLWRNRVYLGMHDIADPFRATVEFQDSRRYNSDYARDNRDVNEFDFIQAYGELYFKNAIGKDRPVSIRIGRMAYEVLDRRLIARNEWRNTTNTFQGVRAIFGQQKNDWQFEAMALQPLDRLLYDTDEPIENQWFFGGIGTWRRWSDIITIQPFYLGLHQDQAVGFTERMIHSPGIRGYGFIGDTGFDYDTQFVYQFGRDGNRQQKAFGSVAELGYRWKDHEWKPRLSVNYGYASGDENPTDRKNQRFERFFGFARPWSNNDYFQWENIHAPKARVEFQPDKKLRIDAGYSAYWLASDTDRWNNANLRDTTGNSGDFIGHEGDIRVRYKLTPQFDVNVGYAYFAPGKFTQTTGRDDASNFVYVELTARLFE